MSPLPADFTLSISGKKKVYFLEVLRLIGYMTTEEQLFNQDIRKRRKNETYMRREKVYRINIQ